MLPDMAQTNSFLLFTFPTAIFDPAKELVINVSMIP